MEDHAEIYNAREAMTAAIEHLKEEFRGLRAGRASSALVEGVSVEVYGTQMRIKEVATITTPEARQLLVTPFDAHNVGPIAKAIDKANLGVQVSSEGKLVRISVPELDEKRRKDLVEQAHKKLEECKIAVRSSRRNANENLKKEKADGLPEDDFNRLEKQVQTLTDTFCEQAEALASAKEKDVMTV